jgi:hypothetical protein
MKRILTDEQVAEAYKIYIVQRLPTRQIGKMFGCSDCVIQKEFTKAGLKVRDRSRAKQKYPINESIFDNIDSEEKAYWLGFLYADGNVSKTNRTRLSLAEQDKEIIEKFSIFIFGQIRAKYYKQPKGKKGQNLFYVDVCNKHIATKLTELGCPPKKTFILTFPEWLDKSLYSHFIRGYFDGDGCLSNYKEARKNSIKPYHRSDVSILSTKEFLVSLQSVFQTIEINSFISKRYKNRKNNNFNLRIRGNRQIEKLMSYLYKDANIFLTRKYNKYLELKTTNELLK